MPPRRKRADDEEEAQEKEEAQTVTASAAATKTSQNGQASTAHLDKRRKGATATGEAADAQHGGKKAHGEPAATAPAAAASSSPSSVPAAAGSALPPGLLTSLASHPLFSRVWFHSRTGTPFLLSELQHESEGEGEGEGEDEGGGADAEADPLAAASASGDPSPPSHWLFRLRHKLIDQFSDVSSSEKTLMKCWNEFVGRRRNPSGWKAKHRQQEAEDATLIYGSAPPTASFPCLLASFARVCAPMLQAGELRTAFLSHSLTAWEFGLIEMKQVEQIFTFLAGSIEPDSKSRDAGNTKARRDESRQAASSSSSSSPFPSASSSSSLFSSDFPPPFPGGPSNPH